MAQAVEVTPSSKPPASQRTPLAAVVSAPAMTRVDDVGLEGGGARLLDGDSDGEEVEVSDDGGGGASHGLFNTDGLHTLLWRWRVGQLSNLDYLLALNQVQLPL